MYKYTTFIQFAVDLISKIMKSNITYELTRISLWLKKLSLKIKKTHYMVFSKNIVSKHGLRLQIDGEAIN